jgi:hypothetical protein
VAFAQNRLTSALLSFESPRLLFPFFRSSSTAAISPFQPHRLKLHAPQKPPFTSRILVAFRALNAQQTCRGSCFLRGYPTPPQPSEAPWILSSYASALGCSASAQLTTTFVRTYFAKHRGVHSKWRASSVDIFVPILAFQHRRVKL